jgi:tRNA threonylcarbamoyladenosine biosynthesis protein TsaB
MILVAVDTSTTSCSVALFSDEHLLAETTFTSGKTHSRHLMSMIQGLLGRCECHVSDIDAIGVARGPGTFTGLRIGISTVKGLAAATRAQIVGVSSLAALASPLMGGGQMVVAMIDARRGEVYHAHYRDDIEVAPVSVSSPEDAAEKLPADAVLVGSGALLYTGFFNARCPHIRIADRTQHVIRAASVGRLAIARILKDDVDTIDALVPEYIRKSDAQIQLSGSC